MGGMGRQGTVKQDSWVLFLVFGRECELMGRAGTEIQESWVLVPALLFLQFVLGSRVKSLALLKMQF